MYLREKFGKSVIKKESQYRMKRINFTKNMWYYVHSATFYFEL